jgi:fibronectin type 3 domain-containing protein
MARCPMVFLFAAAAAVVSQQARAQTCTSNVPHVTGQWMTLPYQMPINPINATLLSTGQVLIVAGSENDAKNNSPGAESYRNAVWDPTGTTESSISVQNLDYDVFCSGTAALPDGRALVVGGTSDYSFTGDKRASIFDPMTGKFAQSQSMVDGRWYATATTLGDGRVMTFSGLSLTGGTNNTVEIYDLTNAGAGWSAPKTAPFSPPLYPRMALLPNGKVFYTGHGSGGSNANGWIFDPAAGTWTSSVATTQDRSYGSFVLLPLLPPSYTPRVMNFGGSNPGASSTEIIDLSAASPSWTPGPSMSTGRIQMNAVILPNGKVLAEGGSVNNESPNTPGKTADLYDPVSNSMSSGGTASYSRLYHSTALLLPDATVVSMGSNPGTRGRYEAAIEIYTPPYLFDANDRLITTGRPAITGVSPSGVIGYGQAFSVSYTSASSISSAVLVRLGSTTHADDMDQRLIGLCGPSPQPPCTTGGTLNLTSPPNGNIAPPGYYMLFVLDSAGVPSKARFIQLSLFPGLPPRGTIASPASDVTIPAGGSVNFGSSTSAAKYSWVFPGGSPVNSAAQNPGNVTFSSPGEYVTSLTVIDSSGNSDPSPPTRTITVLPATADFSITVSPSAQEVAPGGSSTFTVTVSPLSGFGGTVSLAVGSEAAFPTEVTSGGFSPASITGSGSSTLTMNTTTSAVPYALSLTVTGTSGSLTHTASTTLLVNLAPPASLTAVPGNGQVSLSWSASVGATGYNAKRATVSGGPYVTVACPTTATSYTDTGLNNGTTYYYVVSASFTGGPDAGGESADSSQASATPLPSAPSPPTGLNATPGSGQAALSWTASSGATSYRVKRASVSGGPYTTIASPTSTSYTDSGLTNGTTYYYVVSAVNSGGESGNSSQVSAVPQANPPSAPTGLTANSNKPRQIALLWTQSPTPSITQNRIYRRTSGGSYPSTPLATIVPATSYKDNGLPRGAAFCYVVTAVTSAGESSPSNEACGATK